MIPRPREFFFVVVPLLALCGVLVLLAFFGGDIVGQSWLVFCLIASVVLASASGFLAYFEDRVRNGYAWAGIFLNGFLGISVFAMIYWVSGVVCAAAVCTGAIDVEKAALGLRAPVALSADQIAAMAEGETAKLYVDFQTAFYFATVTFTTLGYGDLQPVPDLRLLAGLEAMIGYVFLGFLVGAAFHWASRNDDEVHLNWKSLRMNAGSKRRDDR